MIDYAKEYDNSGRVENSAALIDAYIEDAAQFRESGGHFPQYDLAYGPQARNRLDLFWPDTEEGREQRSPIVMFIHGGYWQRLDRSAFSHMAKGLNARGIAVALPSYTLCPDISIGGIVMEMRRACLMIYQTFKRPLTVIGHSAGGHLAACMMATDWNDVHPDLPPNMVQSGLGISGLYDLLPLIQTPVNAALKLDETHAIDNSPVGWVPEALSRFDAWVGGEESDEYHRQSRDLAQKWAMLGTSAHCEIAEGQNHFTIIDALTDEDSTMVKRIVELVRKPEETSALETPDDEAMDAALIHWDERANLTEEDDMAGLFEEETDPDHGEQAVVEDEVPSEEIQDTKPAPLIEAEDLTDLPPAAAKPVAEASTNPAPRLAMPEGLDMEIEFDENWEAEFLEGLQEETPEAEEVSTGDSDERREQQEDRTTAPEKA